MTEPLLITIILEALVLLLLGERSPAFFLYWTAITTLTNVPANLFIIYVFRGGEVEYYITVAIIEFIVLVSEFLLCYLYTKDKKKSMLYSLVCNVASYFTGSVVLYLIYQWR